MKPQISNRWLVVLAILVMTLVAFALTTPASALVKPYVISGVVYLDANENGVWDPGEEGYGGEYGVAKEGDDWVWRYRGTDVIFSPLGSGPDERAGDDPVFIAESAPFREMEENEKNGNVCTRQDFEEGLDEGFVARRPCQGTFGMIAWADDVTWEVTIDVPEGYALTSNSVLTFTTGEEVPYCDFGIIPVQ